MLLEGTNAYGCIDKCMDVWTDGWIKRVAQSIKKTIVFLVVFFLKWCPLELQSTVANIAILI